MILRRKEIDPVRVDDAGDLLFFTKEKTGEKQRRSVRPLAKSRTYGDGGGTACRRFERGSGV